MRFCKADLLVMKKLLALGIGRLPERASLGFGRSLPTAMVEGTDFPKYKCDRDVTSPISIRLNDSYMI